MTPLTQNFTLEEFLISQTAERFGIDMTPTQEVIDNLKLLCVTCLQPLRNDAARPVIVSSGYRPPELNKRIGGSPTSAHRFGRAADVRVAGETPYETVERILRLDLVFDQVIHEFGRWVHIGISEMPRHQVLTAKREDGRTVYVPGLEEVHSVRRFA